MSVAYINSPDFSFFSDAKEAIKGSYDNVVETIRDTTACSIAKRQTLNVVQDVAQDFEPYYQQSCFAKPWGNYVL